MAEVQKRQVIIPIGQNLGWLKARESVKDKGGLPSYVLHDDIKVKLWPSLTEPEKEKLNRYYLAWAREALVYPQKGGRFKKGQDVVDSFEDSTGREWVFPASCMPEEAVGRKKVGLFVDPQYVEVNSKRVVVLAEPKSIVVLTLFIQDGLAGLVDERTRVPLELAPEVAERLTADKKRWLYRIDGSGVRPLVGGFFGVDRGYGVGACNDPPGAFGVGVVEAISDPEKSASLAVQQAEHTPLERKVLSSLLVDAVVRLLEDVHSRIVRNC